MNQRDKLIRKRNIAIIGGIIGLLAAFFGFQEAYFTQKELMRLDQSQFGKAVLK